MKHESFATQEPQPLLGFNNNVRYKGRLFHIQTEDSGVRHARIMTHLFADGGRVIKSARTAYAEHVGSRELAQTVRELMKEQHRTMFISLRSGAFDDAVTSVCGPYPEPDAETSPGSRRYAAELDPTAESPSPLPANSAAEAPQASSTPASPPASPPSSPPADPFGTSAGTSSGRLPIATAVGSQVPRPAASFGGMPRATSRSIFGDAPVSEKSLDEVILSYLDEELTEDA